jgi:hypothetical protein
LNIPIVFILRKQGNNTANCEATNNKEYNS